MQNIIQNLKPNTTAPTSPAEMLYAIERSVENAENYLLLAENQLREAADMLANYHASERSADNPDLYARITNRLHNTIACMQCTHKGC